MRTIALGLLAVTVAALAVAEAAMQPTPADRVMLYTTFAGMLLATSVLAFGALRFTRQARSLVSTIRLVALAAVVVAGGAVAVSAGTMFLSEHDLRLVLVALGLGMGLGLVLAVAVASSLTSDLSSISSAAHRVAAGDLTARSTVERGDELGEAAEAFDGMAARLQAAEIQRLRNDEERRRLFAAIGHDLRTPLTSLQAAIEALQDGVATDPARYLRLMSKDVADLERLIEDLTLLARIDAGRLELRPAPFDLSELADEAVEVLQPVAAARGIEIRVDGPGPLPVEADSAALGRVLRNLLDNAIRHSPPGGGVTVELGVEPDWVVASIVDDGPGFADDMLDRAFDAFVRGDEARRRDGGGSGLGLAIAKGLIEGHGGDIVIGEGPGGRVRLRLPSR